MSRIDAMLKWARKRWKQRTGKLLVQHGHETANGAPCREPFPETLPVTGPRTRHGNPPNVCAECHKPIVADWTEWTDGEGHYWHGACLYRIPPHQQGTNEK